MPRFARCLERAASVTWATDGSYLDAPELFAYTSCIAMGNAIIRARALATRAEQIAVWDGDESHGDRVAGTAYDVMRWRATGRATRVVACPTARRAGSNRATGHERRVRGVLFADVRGYSRLDDRQIRQFIDVGLGTFAAVLDAAGDPVLFRNTWGDGLIVVFDTVANAARGALTLQRAFRAIDVEASGLPADLALRVGAHAGPVYDVVDPVIGRRSFAGAALTRAARLEPRTPPGDVYVTDSFAALLSVDDCPDLTCEYVGNLPAAKDYGRMPMYLLREHG